MDHGKGVEGEKGVEREAEKEGQKGKDRKSKK